MRPRVSVCGLLPLLAALTASAQVTAQESPPVDAAPVEDPAPAPSESDPAPPMEAEAPMLEDAPAADDVSYSDSGYSDSAPAAAVAPAEVVDGESDAPALRVGGEFGFFAASGDAGSRLSLSPIVGVGVGVSSAIEVAVDWGFIYHSNGVPDSAMSGDDTTALRTGNPLLSITHRSRSKDTHFSFGGGLTIPLALLPTRNDPDSCKTEPDGADCVDFQQELAADRWIAADTYGHASAIRGDWNQWLWAPDQLATVVEFEAHAVMEEILVRGEAAAALLIPVEGEGDAAFAGQVAAELGYVKDAIRVVMRAQAVATITPSVDDPLQFSIDPYVAWDISDSVTVNGRTTVNLDNPTGFDGSRVWGLRLGADVKL